MLSWVLADLAGNELAEIEHRAVGANVTWPLSTRGHRSATITFSLYDDIADLLVAQPYRGTLSTVLRVTYHDDPIFTGVVVPRFSSSAGTITLNAFAASWRLERAFVHADTEVTDDQGDLVLAIVDLVRPDAGALAAGVLDLPIRAGTVTPSRQRTQKWTAGTSGWSAIDTLAQFFDGVEVDFRPVIEEGDPVYAELDVAARLGTDRSEEIVFIDGGGEQNAVIDLEPGGEATENYSTALGQTSGDSAAPQQSVEWRAGERVIGRYESWLGSSETTDPVLVRALAQQRVLAYGSPPPFVTIKPAMERDDERGFQVAPRLLADYGVGDVVGVQSEVGALDGLTLKARVTNATLREADAAGNVTADIEAVPQVSRAGLT